MGKDGERKRECAREKLRELEVVGEQEKVRERKERFEGDIALERSERRLRKKDHQR